MADAENSFRGGLKDLSVTLKALEKKGVTRKQLKEFAEREHLNFCSYGRMGWLDFASGIALGGLMAAGAGLFVEDICRELNLSPCARVGYDILSGALGFGAMACLTSQNHEYADYDFWRAVRREYAHLLEER